jgi:hypothetical protein
MFICITIGGRNSFEGPNHDTGTYVKESGTRRFSLYLAKGEEICGQLCQFLSDVHSIYDTVSFPVTTDTIMEYNLIACKVLTELVLARAGGH